MIRPVSTSDAHCVTTVRDWKRPYGEPCFQGSRHGERIKPSDRQRDFEFTNIAERFSRSISSDIRWQGVPMRSGSFQASGLDGSFYGPNHEEAGDVFERGGIAGAFSLARQ